MKKTIAIFFVLSLSCVAQNWSGVLDPNRAIDWTFAGVPGGIPSGSWTQCGATINPGATAATIQGALKRTGAGYTGCAANTYIQLAAGTFNLSTGIVDQGVSNTELRGMGADQTHLVFSGTANCAASGTPGEICFQSSDGTFATQPPANIYNWTAGYAKGATQITLSSGVGIVANQTMIVLDQCDTGRSGAGCATGNEIDNGNLFQCGDGFGQFAAGDGCSVNGDDGGFARPHRWQWEIVQAVSCSPACGSAGSTVVTINVPLQHPNWASGNTPQAWLVTPIQNCGVRDLSIDGAALSTASSSGGVLLNNAAQCWVRGVAILHPVNMGIFYDLGFQLTFQDNYVFDAGHNLGYSDPVGIKGNGADLLIQNNILQAERPFIQEEGSESGSVIAYNFGINSYDAADGIFAGILPHATGDDYILSEGNVVTQYTYDQIHGSHNMDTQFRNLFTGWKSCGTRSNCGGLTVANGNMAAITDLSYNRYMNAVGNVLGTPGASTLGYASINQSHYFQGGTTGYIYYMGSGNTAGSFTVPSDPAVSTTAMRWGNYDAFHGATLFCTAAGGNCAGDERGASAPTYPALASPLSTLPASFYLSARPSWWSASIPFPAIGPDVTAGNVGQVSGTFNRVGHFSGEAGIVGTTYAGDTTSAAWGGHVNAIPAMNCYLNVMGGPPDGSGSALTFSANACFAAGLPAVATPTFSPVAGTYGTSQSVTISTTTPSATICYTNDGTTPTADGAGTCTHGTTYSGAVTVSVSQTLMAIGSLGGDADSAVATASYVIGTPTASLAPASLTFGSINVSTTSTPQTLTLSNTGTGAMSITSIAVAGANTGDFFQSNNCPVGSSLGNGSSCTITVTFTPLAVGARGATVSVVDNATGSPHTSTLSGTGVQPFVATKINGGVRLSGATVIH